MLDIDASCIPPSRPASVRRNLPEDNNSDQDVMSARRLESDACDNPENDDNGQIS